MICGAGNEDLEEVRRLAMIYTLAGAKGLDISASPSVVKAAMHGIDRAFDASNKLKIEIGIRPFIMVSIGMPGDHHVRKAFINEDLCIKCGLCTSPVCPTEAIEKIKVKEEAAFVIEGKCIGCGSCSAICPIQDCISYDHNAKELNEILPRCIELGAENIELHAGIAETDLILNEWEVVLKSNPNGYNSVCLDRLHIGNFELLNRIEKIQKSISGQSKLIIQADGYPMSGGQNDFNTTLQAIATADVINKHFNMKLNKKLKKIVYKKSRQIDIVLSGGTNALTAELSYKTSVRFQGVAVGTYARNIIYDHIKLKYSYNDKNFYNNLDNIKSACLIAKKLVDCNINESSKYN